MSVPASGGYYRTGPQIDFGWISQAWRMFQAQAGTWIGVILLYLLIVLAVGIPLAFVTGYAHQITAIIQAARNGEQPAQANPFANIGQSLAFSFLFGIINFVLLGGLYRTALRQVRGEPITPTGVLSALDVAPSLIVVGIITQLLVTIGTYLCILPGFAVAGLFMFAPLAVVDRRLSPIQALQDSVSLLKSQWLMATGFYFVAALLGGLGAIVCGLGLVVTYPILMLSIALGYQMFIQPIQPLPDTASGTPEPGVWPPPPSV